MARGENERQSLFPICTRTGAGRARSPKSQKNILSRQVEKREARPYCRSRQEESCRLSPKAHGAVRTRTKRRSAYGSQAGTTEHSGFLPQHGTKGTAQHYNLSGQRSEADGPYPIIR